MPKRPDDVRFSNRPQPDDMKTKLQLIRVGPKGLGPVVVLSHDVVGAYTHYQRGRTRPCPGENCGTCDDGEAARWRGYLVVASRDLAELRVVELTPAVMSKIDDHFRDHRTLRGASISLKRKNERPNGELWIGITPKPARSAELPKAPSLPKFLAALWGVTPTKQAQTQTEAPKIYPPQQGPDFGEAEAG